MSNSPSLLSDRQFQSMRQEAKAMVVKPTLLLSQTKEFVAVRHGFRNWQQVQRANQKFKRVSQKYVESPVFFWDVKEDVESDMDALGPVWHYDPHATEFCSELLWKKPRIRACFKDRKEWLDGVLYTAKWTSFEDLDFAALSCLFREPEYVFIKGCFIPFDDLRESPKYPGELEAIETNLVIFDEAEPHLNRLHDGMSAAVFDFSNKFDWELGMTSLINAVDWTASEVVNAVIDLGIEQVVLISPPDEVTTSLKSTMASHLVHVVELSF